MSEIYALEQQLEEGKKSVELYECLERLLQNRDFQRVINKEFLVEWCARYAHNSQNPAMDKHAQEDALNMAQAAGHLKRWFSVLYAQANQARGQIEGIEEALVELRQEAGE